MMAPPLLLAQLCVHRQRGLAQYLQVVDCISTCSVGRSRHALRSIALRREELMLRETTCTCPCRVGHLDLI